MRRDQTQRVATLREIVTACTALFAGIAAPVFVKLIGRCDGFLHCTVSAVGNRSFTHSQQARLPLPDSAQKIVQLAPAYNRLEGELATLEASFQSGGETLYDKRNLIKKMRLGDVDVVVKAFKQPRALQGLVYANWRPSKAARSFAHAGKLQALAIATPAPIACIETIENSKLTQSYYITRYYPHDFSMQPVLQALGEHSDGDKEAQQKNLGILREFVRFTYKMHQAGVLHHDHNASNTLVSGVQSQTKEAAEPIAQHTFAIIDINRMQFKNPTIRERLNNFVRLSDSPQVMQCIADTYAQCMGMDTAACFGQLMRLKKRHWRRIALKKQLKKLIGR